MRISTGMLYYLGSTSLQQGQQELVRLQQQIASGRRIVKPSDDPVAASAVLDVNQSKALVEQYRTNADGAKGQLGLEENALADMTTVLQNVKTLAVYAGNASLSNTDRDSLATEVETAYQQLLEIANRRDSKGQYLFSGYQGATVPFSQVTPGNVTYNGDAGHRDVQIGAGRAISVNDSGEAVFRAIRNGNGTFVTAAAGANTGTGVIGPGSVTDPSKWNGPGNPGSFTIRFDVTATGAITYDIVDNVSNLSLLTGAAPAAGGPYLRTYSPGGTISLSRQVPPDTNPIAFDYGATVTIDNRPADGDTFTINSSTNQDIFTTLQAFISNLRSGVSAVTSSGAAYQNSINGTMLNLDNALDSVLNLRTSVGSRLAEIDAAKDTGESLSVQYSQMLSGLQDLDYAKAISDLSLQQTYLQAAQQSFLRITGLSLFDLL